MQQLVLNIDENRFPLLLQFLETLDYVRIVKPVVAPGTDSIPDSLSASDTKGIGNEATDNQLALLRKHLQRMSTPLFQNIPDPVAWQKQQRDEWS